MSQDHSNYRARHAPFYCRTVEMSPIENQDLPDILQVTKFFAAYIAEGKRSWTVQEVRLDSEKGQVQNVYHSKWENLTFFKAMQRLAFEERACLKGSDDEPATHTATGPTPDEMQHMHYGNYMEREGLLRDIHGNVRVRPHNLALPENTVFNETDIARANAAWAEKDVSAHTSPLAALPGMDLIDLFASAANAPAPLDADALQQSHERIEVLNKFMHALKQSMLAQKEYVETFRQLNKGPLISKARETIEEAIKIAEKDFSKVSMPYGQELHDFTVKRHIELILLHTTALKTIYNEDLFESGPNLYSVKDQKKDNLKTRKAYIRDAQKLMRSLNMPADKVDMFEDLAMTTEPTLSPWLEWIAKDYDERKREFLDAAKNNYYLREDEIIPKMIRQNSEDKATLAANPPIQEAPKKKKSEFRGGFTAI